MDFIAHYGLFFLKVLTLLAAALVFLSFVLGLSQKSKGRDKSLRIKKMNERYGQYRKALLAECGDKAALKAEKKRLAALKKNKVVRKKIFVLRFDGDLRAQSVTSLREEVTAILTVVTPQDEVVVCLESAGGQVHGYGLAASQLQRLRDRAIPLTVIVDKVAASGGYLMACVANRILCAPFAIIGSIGVAAELPNFHRFLKKHNVDIEQITSGKYKRTLSVLGENTKVGREKVKEELDDIHRLFKDTILNYRPDIDIETVATGEVWHGRHALAIKLVDDIVTSDDYLLSASETADIYSLCYPPTTHWKDKMKRSIIDRVGDYLTEATRCW